MIYHGDEHKRKPTGGRRKKFRKKRKAHMGRYPALTKIAKRKIKKIRTKGGGTKIRLLADEYINVNDPETGKTYRAKILRFIDNAANRGFAREGILTKGAIVETEYGEVRITNRPGQEPLLNGVLIRKTTPKKIGLG